MTINTPEFRKLAEEWQLCLTTECESAYAAMVAYIDARHSQPVSRDAVIEQCAQQVERMASNISPVELCGEAVHEAASNVIENAAAAIRALKSAPVAAPAAPTQQPVQGQAALDVLAERRRQVEAEGWTPEHDDDHSRGELSYAACSYAVESGHLLSGMLPDASREPPFAWPWDKSWWKSGSARRNLVKAGALIIAEIERIDRAAPEQQEGSSK